MGSQGDDRIERPHEPREPGDSGHQSIHTYSSRELGNVCSHVAMVILVQDNAAAALSVLVDVIPRVRGVPGDLSEIQRRLLPRVSKGTDRHHWEHNGLPWKRLP